MAVPSKAEQINRVEDWLASLDNDDRTVGELAKVIVDGMYSMWGKELTDPPMRPIVGMAFKVPILTGPHFVAWIGEEFGKELVWIVNATSEYGLLLTPDSSIWRIADASTAKTGAPGKNADGWQVNDVLSLSQRAISLTVVAVSVRGVLMRNCLDLSLWAESNVNLKKYYKKEISK